jgi:TRAP-type C4-dicarboxylate transport system permease small subunit
MLARAYRAAEGFARAFAFVGVVLLVVTMVMTVTDIALRRTINLAIAGTVDITQLLVMASAFMAIPYAFFAESHVAVEIVVDRLPRRGIAVFKAFAALLALAFMAVALWYGWGQAMQQHGYGDRSQTIGIPILFYWAPLLAGCTLSIVATALLALRYGLIAAGRDVITHERV